MKRKNAELSIEKIRELIPENIKKYVEIDWTNPKLTKRIKVESYIKDRSLTGSSQFNSFIKIEFKNLEDIETENLGEDFAQLIKKISGAGCLISEVKADQVSMPELLAAGKALEHCAALTDLEFSYDYEDEDSALAIDYLAKHSQTLARLTINDLDNSLEDEESELAQFIKKFSNLKSLKIYDSNFEEQNFNEEIIRNLTELEELYLPNYYSVSGNLLNLLAENYPQLKTIEVCAAYSEADSVSFRNLFTKCTNLENVTVTGCYDLEIQTDEKHSILDEPLEALTRNSNSNLKHLDLNSSELDINRLLNNLITNCVNLETLNLHYVTDGQETLYKQSLINLLERSPNLKSVILPDGTKYVAGEENRKLCKFLGIPSNSFTPSNSTRLSSEELSPSNLSFD